MDLKSRAACTISSKNYLAFALTLANSFFAENENCDFHILVVDRKDESLTVNDNRVSLTWVEDLGIPNFHSFAFKYDILELNTNVKPTFLKFLLKVYGRVLYIDPDIFIYQSMSRLFESLDTHSVLVTPHITAPIDDLMRPNEVSLLRLGVFNLGFLGVRADDNAYALLNWWERRCLNLGYNDVEAGLFVDQKWSILFQSLFEGVHIEKHPGYNVAYWNLQERKISSSGGQWIVNGNDPLVFFHFSGINIGKLDSISRHLNRFTFNDFPELKRLFGEYAEAVELNEHKRYASIPYGFAAFDNGKGISSVARRLYSYCDNKGDDPFSAESEYYRFCKRNNLLILNDTGRFNNFSSKTGSNGWQMITINWGLRQLLRLLGAEKYDLLNRYFRYISILRNQKFLVSKYYQEKKS